MEEQAQPFALRDIYEHPFVQDLIRENRELRELATKPQVKDLREIPLPYTVENCILIKEGVHNGVYYPAEELKKAVDQHEGLQIYLDHKDTKGEAAQTWIGAVHNPKWSERDKAILGDIDIVDPKTAMAIAYGAKFGLSATVDVDSQEKDSKTVGRNLLFKSYSIVVNPAVRETMLNEAQDMATEELDYVADLQPALSKLDDAIRRASSMKDTSLLTTLQQIKAIVSKVCGKEYPYPKPGSMSLDALSEQIAALAQAIKDLQSSSEPSSTNDNEELEAVKKENEELKEKLNAIQQKEHEQNVERVLKKEIEVGLTAAADAESRRKELLEMDSAALTAVEQNLDRTIKILETNVDDTKPAETTPSSSSQELSQKSSSSSEKLLQMMIAEQNRATFNYGGDE
ncbi:MAG: hypothetical protein DRG33_01395 [Deltaproteobacteria bacterium]|nr:MAG: hypothetical protein DRG33_01395 [Deltaproteobacteria bacterium]